MKYPIVILLLWSLNSCGEQAIFKLDIKKKSGLSLNPDIHRSKVFSSGGFNCTQTLFFWTLDCHVKYLNPNTKSDP